MFLTFEELILKSKKQYVIKIGQKNRLKIFSKNVLILKIFNFNSFEGIDSEIKK
jgi:hypothetical protein